MDIGVVFNNLQGAFTRFQFTGGTRAKVYRKLSDYLTHSVSMDAAFETLSRLYSEQNKSDVRASAFRAWSRRLAAGDSPDIAMGPWVSVPERMVLLGARESGDYVTAFRSAANLTNATVRMRGALMKAMIYPSVLLLLLVGVLLLLANVLMPQMTSMLPPEQWGSGQALYSISEFVDQHLVSVLATPVVVGVSILFSLGRGGIPFRFLLDRVPPWNFYRIFQGASLLISLSAMTQSGQSIHESLRQIQRHSRGYMAGHVRRMLNQLERGANPGVAVGSTLLSGEMRIDVRAYGEIGDFTAVLDSIGQQAVDDAIEQIQRVSSYLGNIMLVFVGGFIGWIYLTFFGVIQQIQQSMGGF